MLDLGPIMSARSLKVAIMSDERGATLVIVVIFLPVLILLATFAIDTANWYTHHSHLQTQADAAALAAAQDFQFPCTTTTEEQIAIDVHHYDGTQTGAGNYNQQIPSGKPHGGSEYKVTSLINTPNFFGQSTPNDTINASPCTAGAIDVKVTETNLPWFFQLVNVNHINAQARVSIENLTSVNSGLSPLAEPLPTPNAVTAYLVDEGNKNAVLASVNLSPVEKTNDTSWKATDPSFTFNATGPVGMEIAQGGGSGAVPCENTNGNSCYDTTDSPNIGITYTRVWSNSGSPGLPLTAPVQPQAGDVWLVPAGTACGTGPSGFSNFISTSSNTDVELCANMTFTSAGGTSLSCATASLTLTAAGTTPTMNCPSGGPNGTWTSAAVPVTPSAGPMTFSLSWMLSAGKKPTGTNVTGGDSSGNCTSGKSCQGSFDGQTAASPEAVQRVFSGAYDSQSASSSHSGGVLAASLTDSTGKEIQSTPKSTTTTGVTVNVNVLSFQNSQTIGSKPVELSFGGNQANGSVSCPGLSAGGPKLEEAIVSGCTPPNSNFELNSNFSSEPCNPLTDPATGAAICLPEDPGNGKLDKVLDPAMNAKINGGKNAKCTAFNYWALGNTIPELLNELPHDPRLITLLTTDYGALSNGRNPVPIRAIADFYVTGWKGDPCHEKSPGISTVGQTTGGTVALNYTGDEEPSLEANEKEPAGVLLGHFVQYTALSSGGTGSGQCQQSTSLGNCIAVLTK